MDIIGYSERGMINSFFYELKYSREPLKILKDVLTYISFPFKKTDLLKSEDIIISAKVLIEQSFADFGTSDIVLLLDTSKEKYSIFLEAKVKTDSGRFHIDNVFNEFKKGIIGGGILHKKLKQSNLFAQIYYKMQFVDALRCGNLEDLKNGIEFPEYSTKSTRGLGKNKIVLKAINKITEYCNNVSYVILVPEVKSYLDDFFRNTLKKYEMTNKTYWNVEDWGYLSWSDIYKFCELNNFKDTLRNFEFNGNQIQDEYWLKHYRPEKKE